MSATAETTWFGGTTWDVDSLRWEAVVDSIWTFDTGVGSSFSDPGDTCKTPGLHRTMEGWQGVDLNIQAVPLLGVAHQGDFSSLPPCVGAQAGLEGESSLWLGVHESVADSLCWIGGQGYGNDWYVCASREFFYDDSGCLELRYLFHNDTEQSYDFTFVYVDTSGFGDEVQLARYDGVASGEAVFSLTEGTNLRSDPGPIKIRFCLRTDLGYSDEDGIYNTSCGGFTLDRVILESCTAQLSDTSSFESGSDGWSIDTCSDPGEWAHLAALSDLPPPPPSAEPCFMQDSVLVVFDPTTGMHPAFQENLVVSPWIDLRAAGYQGWPGRLLQASFYGDLPLSEHVFFGLFVQWYPHFCPTTGKVGYSDFRAVAPELHIPTPQCYRQTKFDMSSLIDVGAEQVRIGIFVVNECVEGNCVESGNTSPWFDNIRFGVYGGTSTGISEGDPPTALPALQVLANPSRGSARFAYVLPDRVSAHLEVLDIRGRVLWTTGLSAGRGAVSWPGVTGTGQTASAGLYFARITDGESSRVVRFVVLHP